MAFEGFETRRVAAGECEIALAVGGDGPPVLLLHGYPQTRHMWREVAPRLAERFTVVASDLRGYGDSGYAAADGGDHEGYCKRAMAGDQAAAMTALGFERFALAGHDRGGRVAHRLALDHPERVTRLAVLDIVPTRTVFANANKAVATAFYHWFFLAQPAPLPERLIGADPEFWLRSMVGKWGRDTAAFPEDAMREYLRAFSRPETIHATTEDYRAGASIDLEHDEADLDRGIACPVLALWGAKGALDSLFDPLACWRERAADVRGHALPCGHFLPEEAPEETAAALLEFLAG